MDVTLSEPQLRSIIKGLVMRINYIQTGDVVMSSEDAKNSGKSHLIKPLSEDQMRLILNMKDTIRSIESILTTNKSARLIGT